ncbi:hypothetical protein [Chryseobacterium sp. NKUCC03_KSP]|uniref:hypothetical protein n=1 Tax=Chryseobacterium sp. NKUCC03_KSP TaxID=2842125 RepID=UPI001C5AE9F8|nr:hypothetical protein [Chryseobacterium sp. NKUCC03_KSP]MBW3520680.1 hypothetical protein [Chryseobacterium sp. NKUCC03_KSP]
MSDFKNIVEFFKLNRRSEEANKINSENNRRTLTILETKEDYEINTQDYNGLKLLRDIFQNFAATEVFILNNSSGKEFYVKTNAGTYFNLATEQINTNITPLDLYAVSLEDFPAEIYFYDTVKNCVVFDMFLIKNVQIFPESIRYDPHSDFFEDFSHQETLSYSYKTHKTWVYDFVSLLIPNNDPEGDPFAKQVSDSDVSVTQIRITQVIDIIPVIKESMGKYFAYYNLYKKDDRKIVPFYQNRNHFSDENIPVVTLMFNSLEAFMSYFNDTIFSQTENFTIGKRKTFLNQYYEIVVLPLIRNLESKSTFSYYDALQALYYLPESLFYMLPEGFLWTFFEKAIANDSFTNKPYSKEEDIFLKILKVLASTEKNAVLLIEKLSKNISEDNNSQMLLEFFYKRIHGDNFIEFADIVNKAWRKTSFVDSSSKTNSKFASTNGPKHLPYHSEKLAGFFFSNLSASFEENPDNKDERFLRFKFDTGKTKKVTKVHPKAGVYKDDEEIIAYYYYHPFYPVEIKNTDTDNQNQETAIKLDIIVPAFMLFANSNKQFWSNVIKSGEYALDIGVIALSSGTLSGLAAAEVISALAIARGIGATAAITSSVANIILKLANAEESALGRSFIEYLFWIEMLSLSGELTLAIRNGLKRSATKLVGKEDDIARLEKQLDEAVVEENGKRRKLNEAEKNAIKKEISRLVKEGGDYSSKLAKRVSKALDKAPEDIKNYEDLFKNKEHEWGGVYSKRTKYKDYHTSNLPDQIIWPNRIIEKLENCIVTHNHPNGSGLSIADLKFFLSNKLTEIRAVKPDGSVFSLKNGKILNGENAKFINYEDDLDLILKNIKRIEKDYTMMYKFSVGNTEKIDARMFNEIFDLIKDKITYTHYVH